MKGYKNSTKTVYETEESANYAKGGTAKVGKVMGEFKRGKLHSGSKKGPEVTNPKQAIAIGLSEARKAGADVPVKKSMGGLLRRGLRDVGAGQMVQRVVRKAEGGSVKKPRPYDPVKDEPTSRPLTADEVRNIRNRMKAPMPPERLGKKAASPLSGALTVTEMRKLAENADPKKRAYDPVLDEPTSRPFAKGGEVKSDYDTGYDEGKKFYRDSPHAALRSNPGDKPLVKAGKAVGRNLISKPLGALESALSGAPTVTDERGNRWTREYDKGRKQARKDTLGYAKGGKVKSDMAQDKATVRTAVHKHERAMHPGKPLTKMRNGGKVGC